MHLLWASVNAVTETRDFIQAMWDALPKRFKSMRRRTHGVGKFRSTNAPTVQAMFSDVYRRITGMQQEELAAYTNKAIDNLITNQIKDYVFGKTGQQVAKASKADNRPIGYQAGPSL